MTAIKQYMSSKKGLINNTSKAKYYYFAIIIIIIIIIKEYNEKNTTKYNWKIVETGLKSIP